MGFSSFRINIAVRIALLITTLILCVVTLEIIFLSINLGILAIAQVRSLIRYVEHTNRQLVQFIESIRYSDFTHTFRSYRRGKTFDELSKTFEEVIQEFKRQRLEKEHYAIYLQTIVQHVAIGLIVFRRNGEVHLINNAAKRLFNIRSLKNIMALRAVSQELATTLMNIQAGQKLLVRVHTTSGVAPITMRIALHATAFRVLEHDYLVVSLHDIEHELAERELEAWQNLIRVLIHEITNSVTPIVSLSSTIHDLLTNNVAKARFAEGQLSDIHQAAEAIRKRGQGVLHFVETYRSLTKVPRPNIQVFPVQHLFERVQHLMDRELSSKKVNCTSTVEPDDLQLAADPALLEQVLLNLLLNSLDAVEKTSDPRIRLSAHIDEQGKIVMQVADNGCGIPDDIQEKVFVPFFTTKPAGSGIGLSLSREIVRAHKGRISVYSKAGEGSVFTIRL